MLGKKENFFVKEGYKTNPVTTVEGNPGDYWNEQRLETTKVFQWYTYLRAVELMKSKNLKVVADIGCGPAYKTRHFFDGVSEKTYLVDQPTMGEVVNRFYPNGIFQPVNLETESWEAPEPMDLIINSDVIEHLGDPTNLVNLMKANLAPGGYLVISTPERDYRRGKACMDSPNPQHVREWNQKEFAHYLESEGLTVLEHHFDPPKRTTDRDYRMSKLFYRLIRNRKWSACQTVICQVKG